MGVRRAFVLASIGRYLMMVINLAATLITARLLAPTDFGIAVLGGSALAMAEGIRALGGGAYLVQQKQLTPAQIHTNFTVNVIATAILVAVLLLLTRPLTEFFGRPELKPYLQVALLGFLAGPVSYTISALMSRNLAFGRLALIATVAAAVNAAISIGLALLGWGYMSLAWGSAISTLVGMGLYLHFWRDWTIFRLALREWRNVIGFGVHDSAGGILYQISESVPNLIVGRVLDAGSVGLFQRAVLLALFPERVILAGVGAVALPAFSQLAHDGEAKQSYLKVLGLVTAAQWPALAVLILLAHPIVGMLLGSQWQEVAPLLQVFGGALLFSFPIALQYPTLVALGAIRVVPLTTLAQVSVTLGTLAFAAPAGLKTIALCTFVSVPFCGLLSLTVIRHFLKFDWLQLAAVLARSALVTLLSAAGPVAVMTVAGWQHQLSIPLTIASGALAGIGWFFGLWLTRHPLWQEILPFLAKLGSLIGVKGTSGEVS